MSGTQSILYQNKETLFSEFEDRLICQTEEMYTNEKFLIGKPVEDEELWHTLAFYRLLCTDSCEMTNYINRKILKDDVGCEDCRVSEVIKYHKKRNKKESCSDTDIVSESCPINKPEW